MDKDTCCIDLAGTLAVYCSRKSSISLSPVHYISRSHITNMNAVLTPKRDRSSTKPNHKDLPKVPLKILERQRSRKTPMPPNRPKLLGQKPEPRPLPRTVACPYLGDVSAVQMMCSCISSLKSSVAKYVHEESPAQGVRSVQGQRLRRR